MRRQAGAEEIAERLRQEPYHPLWNNCIAKSIKFARRCRREGIDARLVISLGLAKARLLGHRVPLPMLHAWGEVTGRRLEVSTPAGMPSILGILWEEVRPLLAVWPLGGTGAEIPVKAVRRERRHG